MTKTEVLTLIQDLALDRADADTIAAYLDDVLKMLANNSDALCDLELVPVVEGTKTYVLADHQVRLMSAFYDDRELMRTPLQILESVKGWRTKTGSPRCFVQEGESEGSYTLHPTPERNSKDFIYIWGEPLGKDFPAYSMAVLFTRMPDNTWDIPEWLGFILAWSVLALEFSRVSDHQDPEFAEGCSLFAKELIGLMSI
jgi:hypothetical protein